MKSFSEVLEFINGLDMKKIEQEHFKTNEITKAMIQKIGGGGLLGTMALEEYGGSNFTNVQIGEINRLLGKKCYALRSVLTVQGMVIKSIEKWGTKEQCQRLLPKLISGDLVGAFALSEEEVGSNASGVQTVFKDVGYDKIILSGQKKWITLGQVADVFIVFGKLNGKVTAVLLDKEVQGFKIKKIDDLIGLKSTMLAMLSFDNCIIDKNNILGIEGEGIKQVAMYALDYGRYTVAWGCVGLAEECINLCIDYVKKRKQFDKLLINHQLIQKLITEMVVECKASAGICLNAGVLKDKNDFDSILETWCAKYKSSIMVNDIVSKAMQIFGAKGYSYESKIGRYYCEARAAEIIEGTTQMHEIMIALEIVRKGEI